MALPTWWTWVRLNSGSWWGTGRPGVLQFMGLQRVRHNWVTELNWISKCVEKNLTFIRSENEAVCTSEGSLNRELESSAWLHWLYRFAELRAQSRKTSLNDWREHPWRPPSQSIDILGDGWGCLSIEQITIRQGQVRQKALTASSSCQEVSTTLMPVLDNYWLHMIIFPLKNKIFLAFNEALW